MLMTNSTEFSSDLAKASVVLASAAYNHSDVWNALGKMGYEIIYGEEAYSGVDNIDMYQYEGVHHYNRVHVRN